MTENHKPEYGSSEGDIILKLSRPVVVHSTFDSPIPEIIKEGIKPPKLIQADQSTIANWPYYYNPDHVYLTVFRRLVIEGKPFTPPIILPAWGDHHFIIDNNWIREHTDQFRAHDRRGAASRHFKKFLREYNILDSDNSTQGDRCEDQIVSLETIPPEALEGLVGDGISSSMWIKDILPPRTTFYDKYH